MYCACIWRTEINSLENKNSLDWVQLGWTVCNWGSGKGFREGVDLRLLDVGRRLQNNIMQLLYYSEKNVVRGVAIYMRLIKMGITGLKTQK